MIGNGFGLLAALQTDVAAGCDRDAAIAGGDVGGRVAEDVPTGDDFDVLAGGDFTIEPHIAGAGGNRHVLRLNRTIDGGVDRAMDRGVEPISGLDFAGLHRTLLGQQTHALAGGDVAVSLKIIAGGQGGVAFRGGDRAADLQVVAGDVGNGFGLLAALQSDVVAGCDRDAAIVGGDVCGRVAEDVPTGDDFDVLAGGDSAIEPHIAGAGGNRHVLRLNHTIDGGVDRAMDPGVELIARLDFAGLHRTFPGHQGHTLAGGDVAVSLKIVAGGQGGVTFRGGDRATDLQVVAGGVGDSFGLLAALQFDVAAGCDRDAAIVGGDVGGRVAEDVPPGGDIDILAGGDSAIEPHIAGVGGDADMPLLGDHLAIDPHVVAGNDIDVAGNRAVFAVHGHIPAGRKLEELALVIHRLDGDIASGTDDRLGRFRSADGTGHRDIADSAVNGGLLAVIDHRLERHAALRLQFQVAVDDPQIVSIGHETPAGGDLAGGFQHLRTLRIVAHLEGDVPSSRIDA